MSFVDDVNTNRTGELGGYTEAQLYEMNQQLLEESVLVRPLIGSVEPMQALRVEYENGSSAFLRQIDELEALGFKYIRRARGDGDCFYRALGFAFIERFTKQRQTPARKALAMLDLHRLESTPELLDEAGVEKLVYEDFWEVLIDVARSGMDEHRLLTEFQTPEVSNAIVMYLRLVTSSYIRCHANAYEGFLMHPDTKDFMDVAAFCANVVQAMGKEADNVEMDALCRALYLDLDVAYLSGGPTPVDFVRFRFAGKDVAGTMEPLVLLYRPGHYDILVSE